MDPNSLPVDQPFEELVGSPSFLPSRKEEDQGLDTMIDFRLSSDLMAYAGTEFDHNGIVSPTSFAVADKRQTISGKPFNAPKVKLKEGDNASFYSAKSNQNDDIFCTNNLVKICVAFINITALIVGVVLLIKAFYYG